MDIFKEVLTKLDLVDSGDAFTKESKEIDALLKVDFKKQQLIYPEDKGLTIDERQTFNFSDPENFVVFEL